jgi:hypothetical protein
MGTDLVKLAGSKRLSPTGDDGGEKRCRASRPEDSSETLANASSEGSNCNGTWSTQNSKQSRPVVDHGASIASTCTADRPEDMLIQSPSSAKENQFDSALAAMASFNERGSAVAFNRLDNGDDRLLEMRSFEAIPLPVDVLLAQTSSSSALSIQACQIWLFLILLFAGCCCATAFFQSSPDVRTFHHIIPPKHALDAAKIGRNVNQDLLESHLSNLTLRDFLTDPRGFHLGMAVRII